MFYSKLFKNKMSPYIGNVELYVRGRRAVSTAEVVMIEIDASQNYHYLYY